MEEIKISISEIEPLQLPTIALRGLVVFPNNIVHFEVGRKKSMAAIEWAMEHNSDIFLVTQKNDDEDDPSREDLYTYGVIAKIKQAVRVSNDLVKVLVEGKTRAKLITLAEDSPFLLGTIRKSPVKGTKTEPTVEVEALVRSLKGVFHNYIDLNPRLGKDVIFNIGTNDEPTFLCEYMSSNLIFDYHEKQEIMNENTLVARLNKLLELLLHECDVLQVEQEIQERVNESMDKHQRDYYLREQLNIIHEELDDGDNVRSESADYRAKVLELGLEEEHERKLLKEVDRLSRMQSSSPDANIIRTYLDTCIDLPWHNFSEENLDLKNAENVLNKEHYGLEKVKDRILEILAVRKLSPDLKGQIICLVGPPGVGKTSIAKSIADSIGRNYVRLSLGGVRDEAEIRGHRRTYIGAMPGKMITAMISAKTQNPLILLDEVDKLANDFRGDPAAALLEALDPAQNATFKDHFLDMPYDLSNVLFITTANSKSTIPGPLLDRMDVIELSSYTRSEKYQIARKHLLPKQVKNCGLTGKVTFAQNALYSIIDGYTKEAGVRSLERTISEVLRKCARKIASSEVEKITVNAEKVTELLGPSRRKPDFLNRNGEVGIANGLAWTSVGGEMLPIEVEVMEDGTGKVEVTGSLGDVMKESAKLALTYARVHASEYGFDASKLKNCDIHIHAPEGAVPKDGPSAGVTLTTALISCLSGRVVRGDVAMTGEIALHGAVLPIGGLREKSMAAFREGMKVVLIPAANEADLYEVDEEVKKKLCFIPMSDLSQVLDIAFVPLKEVKGKKKTKKTPVFEVPAVDSTKKTPVLCKSNT